MTDSAYSTSKPWQCVGLEIADVLSRIDANAFAQFSAWFQTNERRWFFSGQGRSALVAQMAAMRFMHLGYNVHVVGEATAPSIRENDGLLMISGSGETPVSLSFTRIAKDQGALVATLTQNPNASVAMLADAVLQIPVNRTEQFGGSLFEQSVLILLDSIALGLMASLPNSHSSMQRRHSNLQ